MRPATQSTSSGSMLRHLQRSLVPFLSLEAIERKLAEVDAAGVLMASASKGSASDSLWSNLNACLFRHPSFVGARESRSLAQEFLFWNKGRSQLSDSDNRRYRIEQTIRIADRKLLDEGLLQLWLSVPRRVEGVQKVRITSADPPILNEHYLPTEGQIYGAGVLIQSGRETPVLRLSFDVEQTQTVLSLPADADLVAQRTDESEARQVAHWMERSGIDVLNSATGEGFINLVLDRMQDELKFAISARARSPVKELMDNKAGDVAMQTRFLAVALSCVGIATRVSVGQRLMLDDGHSKLWYPGSTGYDHVFIEWFDPRTQEGGVVDLSYLERWSYVATPANTPNNETLAKLTEVAQPARAWLRRNLYPIDLILSGCVPKSRMYSLVSSEGYSLFAPVDVQIESWRLQ